MLVTKLVIAVALLALGTACRGGRGATPGSAAWSGPVAIPGGTYTVGCSDARICADHPPREVTLAPFAIDPYPVLLSQYGQCVDAGVCTRNHQGRRVIDAREIVFVPYVDADRYCRWRSGRLPTPDEWEVAGRGRQGFLYPWGNAWDETKGLEFHAIMFTPDMGLMFWRAGNRPGSRSPFGVEDMSGGAAEYVQSTTAEVRGSSPELIKTPEDFTLVKRHRLPPGRGARFRCVYPR